MEDSTIEHVSYRDPIISKAGMSKHDYLIVEETITNAIQFMEQWPPGEI